MLFVPLGNNFYKNFMRSILLRNRSPSKNIKVLLNNFVHKNISSKSGLTAASHAANGDDLAIRLSSGEPVHDAIHDVIKTHHGSRTGRHCCCVRVETLIQVINGGADIAARNLIYYMGFDYVFCCASCVIDATLQCICFFGAIMRITFKKIL